jgi:hypothetical protein
VGDLVGANPVDRGKPGSKYHLLIDASGLPLAVGLSAANAHDSQLLEPMVDAVPAVIGPRWNHMVSLHGDGAGLAAKAAEILTEIAPKARDRLREEMRKLEAGGSSHGDMSYQEHCIGGIIVAVGLGALGLWPLAFVAAAGAGAYCGAHDVFG